MGVHPAPLPRPGQPSGHHLGATAPDGGGDDPAAGRPAGLVIQALRHLGPEHITPERIASLAIRYPASGRVFFSGGIINRASGKGLDVEGRSSSDAANVQQWDFGGNPNQTWDVIDQGNGTFSIISHGSGKALDVANHNGADGANIQQFRFANGDNQLWRLERGGGGFYQIVSVSSGKCLDVDSAQINENGGNVQQWSCSGAANQQWRLGK